jgi:hypothetical protein
LFHRHLSALLCELEPESSCGNRRPSGGEDSVRDFDGRKRQKQQIQRIGEVCRARRGDDQPENEPSPPSGPRRGDGRQGAGKTNHCEGQQPRRSAPFVQPSLIDWPTATKQPRTATPTRAGKRFET